MYNIQLFNQYVFNTNLPINSLVVDGQFVYWNYVLHKTDFVRATAINYDDANNIDIDTFNNPLDDWQTATSYYIRWKVINVKWVISKDNSDELNQEIDTFKSHIFVPEQKLSIKVNGEVREATAYCSWVNFARDYYHINFVPFDVSFVITSEVWETFKYESHTVSWLTTTLVNEVINYWKFKAKPVIIITINSTTATNEVIVTLWSSTITISETLVANDIIIIDRENLTITINDVQVDYIWTIPSLEQWRNAYTVQMNGTYNYDVTINYKKTFI
jgi:hypothetical protein